MGQKLGKGNARNTKFVLSFTVCTSSSTHG
jgi:hypothetical protein